MEINTQFPQSLPFERFQYLYMALDACFKLVACKQVKTPSVPHGRRIEWLCTTLGLPVSERRFFEVMRP